MMPNPPGIPSSLRAGYGLTMSKKRKRMNATRTGTGKPVHKPAGTAIKAINCPATSSTTTFPGSFRPLIRLSARGCPSTNHSHSADDGELNQYEAADINFLRNIRVRKPCAMEHEIKGHRHERPPSPRRERYIADAAGGESECQIILSRTFGFRVGNGGAGKATGGFNSSLDS